MRNLSYDREAAIAYARRWALDRNPAYYNFDRIGGDCTNFVSQCILAGAPQMNFTPDTGWYYRNLLDRAAAWTGVEYLHRFLTRNRSIGPHAAVVPPAYALPGDIVQLGLRDGAYYHSALLIALSPEILIAAHTNDALARPLSSYSYTAARFLHIQGYRTTDLP